MSKFIAIMGAEKAFSEPFIKLAVLNRSTKRSLMSSAEPLLHFGGSSTTKNGSTVST